jgi:hypothetical protein
MAQRRVALESRVQTGLNRAWSSQLFGGTEDARFVPNW